MYFAQRHVSNFFRLESRSKNELDMTFLFSEQHNTEAMYSASPLKQKSLVRSSYFNLEFFRMEVINIE